MEGDDAGTAISNLSLQELNMVKEQLDSEVTTLQQSVNQLLIAGNKFAASESALASVHATNDGKEIMVPLTTSLYVPGVVGDISKVLVDVGTGYFIEVRSSRCRGAGGSSTLPQGLSVFAHHMFFAASFHCCETPHLSLCGASVLNDAQFCCLVISAVRNRQKRRRITCNESRRT